MCSQCLSHTEPALAHGAHSSGSRLLRQEPSEAGPGLHAPPMTNMLRFRHSSSPQRLRLSWACVLCPSQVNPRDRGAWWAAVCGVTQSRTELKRLSTKVKKVKVNVKLLNLVQIFATPWTVAYQAPPSMGFSRQES